MRTQRRTRWFVLLPVAALTTAGLVAAARPEPVSACVLGEAIKWADAHRSELPRTLTGLQSYSMPYQRAIYGALAAPTRIELWHEKLNPYLNADANLTTQQRALLQFAIQNIDVLVSDPTGLRGREFEAKENLESRLIAAFGAERAWSMFTIFERNVQASTLPADAGAVTSNAEGSAQAECSCFDAAGGWECPETGAITCSKAESCTPKPVANCGMFGNDPCNGVCARY